ncbi:MAG: hydroxyacid dehydrogenase [Betaproteobacteria bacterium]|nr:hydroxyacid dehydrogenase [Betaproteobacteria bacterium]
MQKIVISENMDAPAVALLARDFDVDYRPALVDDAAELARALAQADAWIVRNRTQVRGPALAAASRLRVVGRLGVGLDNIDLAACAERGIEVIPASGANAESVAEYVLGIAMVLLRGAAYLSTSAVAAGRWPRQMLSQGREISGKTLGLVGFGSIGQVTARKAAALGLRVVAFDPAIAGQSPLWRECGATPCGLDELLAQADVVSLHLPLADGTRNLIDESRLARMKSDAILVNSARGGIVDEAAVARALRAGRLAGAALDVFAEEPLQAGSILADVPNLILTPHIAGVTRESNERVSSLIAERVAARLRG